jgi:hypothetical protein
MVTRRAYRVPAFGVPARPRSFAPATRAKQPAACPVRAERRTLVSVSSRCARSAARPRRSARQAVQPHARKRVELTDFGTIRSRSTNKEMTHESWRNQADGRLNRTRQTQDASAVCKQPNLDAEGSDAPRDHQQARSLSVRAQRRTLTRL